MARATASARPPERRPGRAAPGHAGAAACARGRRRSRRVRAARPGSRPSPTPWLRPVRRAGRARVRAGDQRDCWARNVSAGQRERPGVSGGARALEQLLRASIPPAPPCRTDPPDAARAVRDRDARKTGLDARRLQPRLGLKSRQRHRRRRRNVDELVEGTLLGAGKPRIRCTGGRTSVRPAMICALSINRGSRPIAPHDAVEYTSCQIVQKVHFPVTGNRLDELFGRYPEHLTVPQLAEVLGVQASTAYKWLQDRNCTGVQSRRRLADPARRSPRRRRGRQQLPGRHRTDSPSADDPLDGSGERGASALAPRRGGA